MQLFIRRGDVTTAFTKRDTMQCTGFWHSVSRTLQLLWTDVWKNDGSSDFFLSSLYFQCYVRCLLDLTGVTDLEEGKYDPEQAALLFSVQTNEETQKDDVEEIAKACMEDRGEACEHLINLFESNRSYIFQLKQQIEADITLTGEYCIDSFNK